MIPSPTNARASLSPFSASSFSTCSTLSPGRSSLLTMSMPISVATLSATFLESPVNITVFFIPFFFNSAIAIFVVGLIISEIVMQPAYTPSTATKTIVPSSCSSLGLIPSFFISLMFPALTFLPSTSA